MFPEVTVDLNKIRHNARHMVSLCAGYGISILGVTKVFCGDPAIARAMADGGIKMLGDSRILNLRKYRDLACEKWLIRMPGISEADDCVQYCDVSLNSELRTLEALNAAAVRQGRQHKVILMADLGDLREGCFALDEAQAPGAAARLGLNELRQCAEYAAGAPGLELYGLGTNLSCFSFVQPDGEKLKRLTALAREYGAETFVSGGNSATIKLMLSGGIPEGVNTLRLGESVLFGRERADFTYLPGMYNDAFTMRAEVIECKLKPTKPIGVIGRNSYGETPSFEDRGERVRAICALGRQDADYETMWPVDPGIQIIGASSDHLVLDVTDAHQKVRVGDTVDFRLGYFAVMRAFTSEYVQKCCIGE